MKLYLIKDWAKYYENGDSRKTDGPLTWVPVRIKTDGFGYLRITQEKDRSDLLAAWYLMLGLAAKQPRSERGKLSRDGVPLSPDDMELLTRFPAAVFSKALVFFSDTKQGWLISEEIRINPDQSGSVPDESGQAPTTLHYITLHNNTTPAGDIVMPSVLNTPAFSDAWNRWVQFRKEKKQKLTDSTIRLQLAQLEKWGERAAIQSIENSIFKGYAGLFEPSPDIRTKSDLPRLGSNL